MDSLRILTVEDSAADRELYKRILTKNGYDFEIFEADTARDGLEYSKSHELDCVVLDYNLPDSDGLDFMTSFKNVSKDPDVAIVMVTGQGSEETAVRALKKGAADYITKDSITEGFFLQTILNAVEKAQLRKEVAKYQEYLEQSNRALSEFAHTVSHDLKAPLRRITAFCDLLEEECSSSMDSQARQYVERIVVNSKRMQKFIDDLLAYSQVLHGNEELQTVDMNLFVKEVIEDLDFLIKENAAHITVEELPSVPVYPVKIRQLFLNLISNAIKYHGEQKPVIRIGCNIGCNMGDEGEYTFIVRDNGQGIPPEHHKNIFKAFERLHSHDAVEGTGLGLSICQKVIEMHGGRIWVESEVGRGSKFFFSLPKKQDMADGHAKSQPEAVKSALK